MPKQKGYKIPEFINEFCREYFSFDGGRITCKVCQIEIQGNCRVEFFLIIFLYGVFIYLFNCFLEMSFEEQNIGMQKTVRITSLALSRPAVPNLFHSMDPLKPIVRSAGPPYFFIQT
ncbi:hypothetical protein C0J52_04014 [Blattella germanica]|nr:hypothetical protein C0J52_04014 [Blattella germanica]